MPGFEVNIYLDPDKFEAALDDWSKATREENKLGALEAAEFIKEVVQAKLSEFPHPRSEPTMTAPFEGPPGLISGHLRDSVEVVPSVLEGTAHVRMGTKYPRIQEFGGWCGTHDMTYVPPRPYFRPSVMEVSTEGEVEHIFYDHWRTAMMTAVLF